MCLTKKKTIAVKTIGCKLNFAETSTIVRDFVRSGFNRVEFNQPADVYIINTCTVTANADKDCRKAIRQAQRNNPVAFMAVVGCYAQLNYQQVSKMNGVGVVLGNDEKYKLFKYYNKWLQNEEIDYHGNLDNFHPAHSADERTRVFLKIQDGCDYECAYCGIPLARGKSRSGNIKNISLSARKVAKTNAKEIVLTGVNSGDFGRGNDETFFDLIQTLDNLDGIERIRISSIEPNLLTAEMIEFVASSNLFVPHFHIPLQSGSNKILCDMKRRYRRELFAKKVIKINSTIPDCCIGVDMIAGFPTETTADFQQSYDFINNLEVSYLHAFSYSPRPNTEALKLKNVVTHENKIERSKQLHELSNIKQKVFHNKFIGCEKKVLFESHSNGILQGHTNNYIKVKCVGNPNLVNTIQPVKLLKSRSDFMEGIIESYDLK